MDFSGTCSLYILMDTSRSSPPLSHSQNPHSHTWLYRRYVCGFKQLTSSTANSQRLPPISHSLLSRNHSSQIIFLSRRCWEASHSWRRERDNSGQWERGTGTESTCSGHKEKHQKATLFLTLFSSCRWLRWPYAPPEITLLLLTHMRIFLGYYSGLALRNKIIRLISNIKWDELPS